MAETERECPYCGFPAANVREEIAHMQEAHPDIIRERLRAAGIDPDDPGEPSVTSTTD